MENHKFELTDKVSTTAINPRPTNLLMIGGRKPVTLVMG